MLWLCDAFGSKFKLSLAVPCSASGFWVQRESPSTLCPSPVFSFPLLSHSPFCVRVSSTQGRGCVLEASVCTHTHTHRGGSLLFHAQTMTCTFFPLLPYSMALVGPVSPDQMAFFVKTCLGKCMLGPSSCSWAPYVSKRGSVRALWPRLWLWIISCLPPVGASRLYHFW